MLKTSACLAACCYLYYDIVAAAAAAAAAAALHALFLIGRAYTVEHCIISKLKKTAGGTDSLVEARQKGMFA